MSKKTPKGEADFQPEQDPEVEQRQKKLETAQTSEQMLKANLAETRAAGQAAESTVQRAQELAQELGEETGEAEELQTELKETEEKLKRAEVELKEGVEGEVKSEGEEKEEEGEEKSKNDNKDDKEKEEKKKTDKKTASEEKEGDPIGPDDLDDDEAEFILDDDDPALTPQTQQVADDKHTQQQTDQRQTAATAAIAASEENKDALTITVQDLGKENIGVLLAEVKPLLENTSTRQDTIEQLITTASKIADPDTMTTSVKANTNIAGKFGGARLSGYQARNLRLLAETVSSTAAATGQKNNREIKSLYESVAHATLKALVHCDGKPPIPGYTDMRLYIEQQVKPLFAKRREFGLSRPLLKEIEKELERLTKDTTNNSTDPSMYVGSTKASMDTLWN